MSIFALIIALAAQQPIPDRYLEQFLAANDALEANDLPRAKQLFERALELRPENPTCAYDLACVAARNGDAKSSLDRLTRAASWGYADADVALWDADLASVRTTNDFKLAVDAMKSRAASAPPTLVTRIEHGVDRSALTCTDDPVASGDGKTLAIALRSGTNAITTTIATIDLEDARRIGAFDLPIDSTVELVRAPDGSVRVFSIEGNVLRERDASSGAIRLEFELPERASPVHSISVSPDLAHAALDGKGIGRALVDLRAKRIVANLPNDANWKPIWVWSADGSTLACVEGKSRVHIVRAADGRDVRAPIGSEEDVYWLAFDRDAKRIAIGGRSNPLRVFNIDSASRPTELTLYECDSVFAGDEMSATWVGFSPGGDLLAAMSSGSDYAFGWSGRALDLRWCDGNREEGHGKAGTRAQFGAITNRLFVSFPARVLDSRDGSSLADLSSPPRMSLGCTPDERFLFATSRDDFRVFDGASYAPRFTFVGFSDHDRLFVTPSFHCSGSIGGLRNSAVVIGDDSYALDPFASALVDPKRVRASAAGAKVEPAHVARPPKLAIAGSSELHVAAHSKTIEFDVEVEDPFGFSGCEAEIDGRAIDRELSKAFIDVGAVPSSKRVHLAIARDPKAKVSSLRISIVSRSGVSSRPLHLRVVADE